MYMNFVPAIWPLSDLGPWEIIIIVVLAVVLFGNRLPQLGRTLGKGLVSFRKGINEMKDEIASATSEGIDKQKKATDFHDKQSEDMSAYNDSGTDAAENDSVDKKNS